MFNYISIRPISTQKRGWHFKIVYSNLGVVKRFSTGIFSSDLTEEDVSLAMKSQTKSSWFKKGDYHKLRDIAIKFDDTVDEYKSNYGVKPTPDKLYELMFGANMQQLEYAMDSVCAVIKSYHDKKENEYLKQSSKTSKTRKRLERYKSIIKTLEDYSISVCNRKLLVEEMGSQDFWEKLFNYLLFIKPRNGGYSNLEPNHVLVEDGDSEFNAKFGISNNTLLKWLKDINTALNAVRNNSFIVNNLASIKDAQKMAVKVMEIKEFVNAKAAVRKKEYDWLKSEEFEDALTDGALKDGSFVSKNSLVKVKDMFVAMTIIGARYEDFKRFKRTNLIQRGQVASKTSDLYIANINDKFVGIMEKYDFDFGMCNQQFNQRIKIVFKQFYEFYKTKEPVTYTDLHYIEQSFRSGFVQTKCFHKYEMIGAHTARRSFATIAYYDGGKSPKIIMKYTGHKSEREFNKYICLKIDDETTDSMSSLFE